MMTKPLINAGDIAGRALNMGMFDWVNYKAPCWKCGEELKGFQSKDADCVLARMEPMDVEHFYDLCPKCGTWNQYRVVPPRAAEIVPDDKRPTS